MVEQESKVGTSSLNCNNEATTANTTKPAEQTI